MSTTTYTPNILTDYLMQGIIPEDVIDWDEDDTISCYGSLIGLMHYNVGKDNPMYGKRSTLNYIRHMLPQNNTGFVFSEERNKKISDKAKGRPWSEAKRKSMDNCVTPNSKSVTWEGIEYVSISHAVKATGVSRYKLLLTLTT